MNIYFVQITDSFHDNKVGFISFSKKDTQDSLGFALAHWDIEFTPQELIAIMKDGKGYAGGGNKSDVYVTIRTIEPDEAFDLE